ncbi:MAG: cobalamin biosynthesis protein CbiM, partial [Desulfuromonas sp.]
LLMQPIHLAIGLVEGLATATVIIFLATARPDILDGVEVAAAQQVRSLRGVVMALLAVTILVGGFFAWFASSQPDGLEWALEKAGFESNTELSETHHSLQQIQEKTAILPEYDLPEGSGTNRGTSLSGLIGSGLTMVVAGGVILLLRRRRKESG